MRAKLSERDKQQFEDRIRQLNREERFALMYGNPNRARELVLERDRLRQAYGRGELAPAPGARA